VCLDGFVGSTEGPEGSTKRIEELFSLPGGRYGWFMASKSLHAKSR